MELNIGNLALGIMRCVIWDEIFEIWDMPHAVLLPAFRR